MSLFLWYLQLCFRFRSPSQWGGTIVSFSCITGLCLLLTCGQSCHGAFIRLSFSVLSDLCCCRTSATTAQMFLYFLWTAGLIWSFIVTADFHLFSYRSFLYLSWLLDGITLLLLFIQGGFFLILTRSTGSWYVAVEVLVCHLVPSFSSFRGAVS